MKKKFLIVMPFILTCIFILSSCSSGTTTDKGDTHMFNEATLKSELIALDANLEEVSQDSAEFYMRLDDNSSLQNCMELSDDNLYWMIWIKNTGNSEIVVEVNGDIHKVESGKSALIYSTEQWAKGTYTVSFASGLPNYMQGTAICYVMENPVNID